jgi:signal transduction histidine kinase
MAQQELQSRDETLRIVAHDLRNPLNTIIIEAELLKMQVKGTEESVASIHSSAVRMSRMIEDLLDVARLEAGVLRIDRARVVLSQLGDQRAYVSVVMAKWLVT